MYAPVWSATAGPGKMQTWFPVCWSRRRKKNGLPGSGVLNGTAADIDLLEDSVSRLKAEYTIVNRQIDLQIAAADLFRALGMAGPGQE